MTILQAIVLGIVQGITEFLPVSSSAHLVVVPALLGWKLPEDQVFVFDVLVQTGTLASVLIFFRTDLLAIAKAMWTGVRTRRLFGTPDARLGWFVLLGTIPAGLAGLLLKDQVEAAFSDVRAVGWFLLVTATFLVLAERLGKPNKDVDSLRPFDAIVIGLFQAIAIFPGVSRSGSTITGGILRGLTREAAARFSFLLSIPIMLAAGLLSMTDLAEVDSLSEFVPALAAGWIASAVVGYLAIAWLLRFLRTRPLYVFAIYVVLLSIAVLVLL